MNVEELESNDTSGRGLVFSDIEGRGMHPRTPWKPRKTAVR